MRQAILEFLINHPEKIGGPGLIVQVDETLIFHRKYGVGRIPRQIWLVGGVCLTQPSSFFLVMLENRNANTMTQVLSNWVYPGSVLVTDAWRSYISAATRSNMLIHKTVNHSYQFVSDTGYHTNNIESLWSSLKRWMRLKKYIYSSTDDILYYLAEFIF